MHSLDFSNLTNITQTLSIIMCKLFAKSVRKQSIDEPNSIPIVFIGSSSEGLNEAIYISNKLSKKDIVTKLWTQGVFELSKTTIEDLVKISKECDFAVLFLTPDDLIASRGKKKASPRDNVIFELGLFIGAIGRERTYMVLQKGTDLKLPSDLKGITCTTFETSEGSSNPLGVRLRQTSRVLGERINSLGPK